MKIHVLSDLHLEFTPFELPETGADVVVLAGVVHTKERGLRTRCRRAVQNPGPCVGCTPRPCRPG